MAFDILTLPYASKGTALAGGSETAVYTCPDQQGAKAQVLRIRITRQSGATGTATVKWYDSSTTTAYWIVQAGVVPANDALVVTFDPLAMDRADEIRVTAAAGYDVIVTYVQYGGRSA